MSDNNPVLNTDRELYREMEGNHYSPSVHVTDQGIVYFNVGGTCYGKTIQGWHDLFTLREQIAREIEAKCRNETKTFDYEGGFITVSGCLEYFDNEVWGGFYRATCSHFEDAAIARGEK